MLILIPANGFHIIYAFSLDRDLAQSICMKGKAKHPFASNPDMIFFRKDRASDQIALQIGPGSPL